MIFTQNEPSAIVDKADRVRSGVFASRLHVTELRSEQQLQLVAALSFRSHWALSASAATRSSSRLIPAREAFLILSSSAGTLFNTELNSLRNTKMNAPISRGQATAPTRAAIAVSNLENASTIHLYLSASNACGRWISACRWFQFLPALVPRVSHLPE